jgi:twitching motility protein PilT
MRIEQLLAHLVEQNGSDLHVKAGMPPVVRVDGELRPSDLPVLSGEDTERLADEILTETKRQQLREEGDAEIGMTLPGLGRFRLTIFHERGMVRIVIRHVVERVPTFEDLQLPPAVRTLASERRGLILVTGTAGTGKTTTIAAMIGHINRTRHVHIVTIEDPVEVVHRDQLALIDQREIGIDVASYSVALRYAVRQDPDVLFLGEIRDLEAAEAAIQAAETGHLVISTMHTTDAPETVNRLIDLFPPDHQHQVRLALASSLKGVVCQRLIPRADGKGRIPAVEILLVNGRVADAILDPIQLGGVHDIMAEGAFYGMQTFEQSLLGWIRLGLVRVEDARPAVRNWHDFSLALKQAQLA